MRNTREYLDFELKYTREILELYQETKDEELRLQILELRKILEKIYIADEKKARA